MIAIVDLETRQPMARSAIRALRRESSLPVVALSSADTSLAEILCALDCGVDDLITKPFASEDFRRRIDLAVRWNLRFLGKQATYACNGLLVDTVIRAVTLNGSPVILSRAEYALLEALVRGGAIAPFVRGATEKRLASFVWRLRRKLKDRPSNRPLILSLRGAGYRLATAGS